MSLWFVTPDRHASSHQRRADGDTLLRRSGDPATLASAASAETLAGSSRKAGQVLVEINWHF